MEKNENYYKSGLKLIIFQLQYLDPSSLPGWDEESKKYFVQAYPGDRIQRIGDGITWYAEHKELDISNLIPDINYSVPEIKKFLDYVLEGLVDSGLYKPELSIKS